MFEYAITHRQESGYPQVLGQVDQNRCVVARRLAFALFADDLGVRNALR
jgi:hypothetical protein